MRTLNEMHKFKIVSTFYAVSHLMVSVKCRNYFELVHFISQCIIYHIYIYPIFIKRSEAWSANKKEKQHWKTHISYKCMFYDNLTR